MKTRLFPLFPLVMVAACVAARPFSAPVATSVVPLQKQCDDTVGPPHIENPAPGVFVAVGYDVANVILVQTPGGNVIVDTGMSPARAELIKADLKQKAPGPVKAVVLTHSHIDHVGGVSAWLEPGTRIWATRGFTTHLLKQYALFQKAELTRGSAQFGDHVPLELLPCSALGRRVDFDASLKNGIRFPTDVFSGAATFSVGGVHFELHEAPGETHDQLFVWLPEAKVILSGDNFYRAFPNLYTIRGTSPRPVDGWIDSIDTMRALAPRVIIPSHNKSFSGTEEIQRELTDYRDAIQWVRDETVRGANLGEGVDSLAARIKLPPALAANPTLREAYGQVDWSVRAIFANNLGWFDGIPEALYPLAPTDEAKRVVQAMGGPAAVEQKAGEALRAGNHRWALWLLQRLSASGLSGPDASIRLNNMRGDALEKLGLTISNTNGRAYLLESAWRLRNGGVGTHKPVEITDELLRDIPLEVFFRLMAVRLKTEGSMDRFQSVVFVFPDEKRRFTVTIRRGIAEVREGDSLPGTPAPVATLTTDSMTWRHLALGQTTPAVALLSGKLKVDGSVTALGGFIDAFDRKL